MRRKASIRNEGVAFPLEGSSSNHNQNNSNRCLTFFVSRIEANSICAKISFQVPSEETTRQRDQHGRQVVRMKLIQTW